VSLEKNATNYGMCAKAIQLNVAEKGHSLPMIYQHYTSNASTAVTMATATWYSDIPL
jgi:hypothetical protein